MSTTHVPTTTERPGTVTAVVVLTYLAGVFDVIAGGVLWALSGNAAFEEALGQSSSSLVSVAIATIVVGLITIGVGAMLQGGSRVARLLVTALMIVRIVAAGISLGIVGLAGAAEAIIAILMAVVILGLLWNARASAWFAAQS